MKLKSGLEQNGENATVIGVPKCELHPLWLNVLGKYCSNEYPMKIAFCMANAYFGPPAFSNGGVVSWQDERQKGHQEGREEDCQEGQAELIARMFKKQSIIDVSELTGLPKEEIELISKRFRLLKLI